MKHRLNDLNFNMLVIFDAVCRLNSTTKAAKELHITQPAISRYLKDLREAAGGDLFVRTPDGLFPNRKCLTLWENTKEILDLCSSLEFHKSKNKVLNKNLEFIIGLASVDAFHFSSRIIPALKKEYPDIDVIIMSVSPRNYAQKILNREIDIYYGPRNCDASKDLSFSDFGRAEYCVLCSDESPLYERGIITKDDFVDTTHYKMYAGKKSTILDSVLSENNLLQKKIVELPDVETVTHMLGTTDGLYLDLKHHAEFLCEKNYAFKILKPSDFEIPHVKLYQVWHQDRVEDLFFESVFRDLDALLSLK